MCEKTLPPSEQSAFEDWLASTGPSGDCESVQYQWVQSSAYQDYLAEKSDWDATQKDPS